MPLNDGFQVPHSYAGMTAMEDAGINNITDKLRFGAPELGWEGDVSLQIFIGPYYDQITGQEIGTSWQVWCFNAPEPYCFMRAKPGTHLDERLIFQIMKHDTHRVNLAHEIRANNERVERELELQHREKTLLMREELYREMTKRKHRRVI